MTATVNVSRMFANESPRFVFASQCELGPDAERSTWEAALDIADDVESWRLCPVAQLVEQVAGWARESGGWPQDEICAWTVREALALLVQSVAADMRRLGQHDVDIDASVVESTAELSAIVLLFTLDSAPDQVCAQLDADGRLPEAWDTSVCETELAATAPLEVGDYVSDGDDHGRLVFVSGDSVTIMWADKTVQARSGSWTARLRRSRDSKAYIRQRAAYNRKARGGR